MISCKTSEAAEKADSSNPEPGEGVIIAIKWGMRLVISLGEHVKLWIHQSVKKQRYSACNMNIHTWRHLSADWNTGNMRVGRVIDATIVWTTIGDASRRDCCIRILVGDWWKWWVNEIVAVGKMLVAVCEICSSLKGSAIHNQPSIPCIVRGNLSIPKYTMSP